MCVKSFQKLKIYMKLLGLNMRCYCHKCRKNNLLINAQEKKKKNWYEGEGMGGPLPHPSLSSMWLQCICGNAIVLPLSLIHVFFFWVFGEKDTLHMKPAHTLRIGLQRPPPKNSIKIQQCQPKSNIHTSIYEWMNT